MSSRCVIQKPCIYLFSLFWRSHSDFGYYRQEFRKLERDSNNQALSKQIVDRLITELRQFEQQQDKLTEYRRMVDLKTQELKEVEMRAAGTEQGREGLYNWK